MIIRTTNSYFCLMTLPLETPPTQLLNGVLKIKRVKLSFQTGPDISSTRQLANLSAVKGTAPCYALPMEQRYCWESWKRTQAKISCHLVWSSDTTWGLFRFWFQLHKVLSTRRCFQSVKSQHWQPPYWACRCSGRFWLSSCLQQMHLFL